MVFSEHFNKVKGQKRVPQKGIPGKKHGKDDKKKFSKRDNDNWDKKNSSKRKLTDKINDDNLGKSRPNKRKRTQPSAAALELSEQLKNLSRQKNLQEALNVYNDPSHASIRDGHHTCIIIDCCARCGDIQAGEKVIEDLKAIGKHVNVETKTALIKGYCHSGKIYEGYKLFESMVLSKNRGDRPNVRTLNTLLRGCLWSAAHPDMDGSVTGGVVTAEKSWQLCKTLQEDGSKAVLFDVSSYEYSTTLLCQALRTDDASQRIDDMVKAFQPDTEGESLPQSVSESLSLSYCSLARSFATLGDKKNTVAACKSAFKYAELSRQALADTKSASSSKGRYSTKQGKESKDGKREESNLLYRNHRLSEVEKEVKVILDISKQDGLTSDPRALARRLITRLAVITGGGTTDKGAQDNEMQKQDKGASRRIQGHLLNTVFFSYGLRRVLEKLDVTFPNDTKFLNKRHCNRILAAVGLQGGLVLDDGTLDLKRAFTAGIGQEKGRKKKQINDLEIELGSGFGDWIVKKALTDPSKEYLSVELRADRVGQTFARAALLSATTPVNNLCVVGAESGLFLSKYTTPDSVASIFINHPEPPTQTFGADEVNLRTIIEGGEEPAHMITSTMIKAAGKCLSKAKRGRLVVVTDNRWYGRLICATLVRVMSDEPGLLSPGAVNSSLKPIETFSSSNETKGSDPSVTLYEGQPNESIGHPPKGLDGATYFDRLWRSGAGSHAEKTSRFIIIACRK